MCLPSLIEIAQSTGLFDRVVGFASEKDSVSLGKVPQADHEDLFAKFVSLLEGPYFLAADFKHDILGPYSLLDHVDAKYRAGFARTTIKGLDILLPTMEWRTPAAAIGAKNLALHAETRLTLLAHTIVETLLEAPLDSNIFQISQNKFENPHYHALHATSRFKIGLNVDAGAELKKWPQEYWRALTQKLVREHDPLLVFFGGSSDLADAISLICDLPAQNVINLIGAIPLVHVPAYMSLLDGYIGCDTGLTHLAARLGIPTLDIFSGTGNISVWRARGPRVKTVYAEVVCSPCHLRFERDCSNRHICMEAIMPDIVYDCFGQLMTSS